MNEMGEVIHRFGIITGQPLSVEQLKAMTLALKAGQLKVAHFREVANITKSFNLVAVQTAKSFAAVIESSARVKQGYIDGLKEIVKSLEKISTSTNDPNVTDKIIDLLMKLADKMEKADERNHKFVMTALAIVGTFAATYLTRRLDRII